MNETEQLLIHSAYQGSHYLSSSLTCELTLDLYSPGNTEVNECHTEIYLTHNSLRDNRSQTHSAVICVGRKNSLVSAGWLIIVLL